MKTIKVLVDELPISCANCRYSEHFYFYGRNWEFCKMADINPVRDIDNKRANGCPLALEHDARIADERKVSIEQIMALKKLAKY